MSLQSKALAGGAELGPALCLPWAAAVLQPGRVAGEAVNSWLPQSQPRAGFRSSARGSLRLLWERRARPPALRLLDVWVWGFSFSFLFPPPLEQKDSRWPPRAAGGGGAAAPGPVLGQGQRLGRVGVRGETLSSSGTGSCAVLTPTGLRLPGVRSGSRHPWDCPKEGAQPPPTPRCWGTSPCTFCKADPAR